MRSPLQEVPGMLWQLRRGSVYAQSYISLWNHLAPVMAGRAENNATVYDGPAATLITYQMQKSL